MLALRDSGPVLINGCSGGLGRASALVTAVTSRDIPHRERTSLKQGRM